MRPGSASVRDVRGLRAELEAQSRNLDTATTADVVIDPSKRLLLRSPNGLFWSITVTDAGALVVTNVGANPL